MAKITGIIIILIASLSAIFCLLFKVKINPDWKNKNTMKAKFLITVSIMMAFFAGFFTSCKPMEKPVMATNITTPQPLCYTAMPDFTPTQAPTEKRVPSSTPTKTPTEKIRSSMPLETQTGNNDLCCYAPPYYEPTQTPTEKPDNTPHPVLCYARVIFVTPTSAPTKKQDNTPQPLCYEAMIDITPIPTPDKNIPSATCYSPAIIPTQNPTPDRDVPSATCYRAVVTPVPDSNEPKPHKGSYINDSEAIKQKKLTLLEEISGKNIIKKELLVSMKENILKK